MANLATQVITRAGLASTFTAAAAGGDTFTPDHEVYLYVANEGGGSITVTVATPGLYRGLAVADNVVTVPAGTHRMLGPYPPEHFADPTDGLADVTYSGVTTVTVGVFKLNQP